MAGLVVYINGVFEGIQVEEGRHLQGRRARRPAVPVRALARHHHPAVAEGDGRGHRRGGSGRSRLRDGYLRPLVSRGEGPLGLERIRELSRPNVVVIPQIRAARGERVLRVVVVATRRTPSACLDPRVKSNNYLNNILGKLEQLRAVPSAT